jgi:hypothetical protein
MAHVSLHSLHSSTFPSSLVPSSPTSTASASLSTSSTGWPQLRIQSRLGRSQACVVYGVLLSPEVEGAALLCILVLPEILCMASLPDPTGEINLQNQFLPT